MTDTTTPALIQADPTTVVIDGNVRVVNTDSPDFTDLVESIKTHGVLTPCRGYRDDDGTIHITEGQRRTLAAAQAKASLPVYLAADADAAEADRILAQLAENDHRATIAASDHVTAYEQLSLLGVSPAQIAKRTRRNRAEVDAALTVAHNPTARHRDRDVRPTAPPTSDATGPRRPWATDTRVCGSPASTHRFPFERLCGTQSISQFASVDSPPLDHAVTWSASISSSL